MFVAVLAQALCPGIPEWLQAVRIYSRGYILTAFVYKDIWHVLADTPLFYEKTGVLCSGTDGSCRVTAAQLHRC